MEGCFYSVYICKYSCKWNIVIGYIKMQRRKLRKFTNQILLIQKKPFTGALLSSCPKKKLIKHLRWSHFIKHFWVTSFSSLQMIHWWNGFKTFPSHWKLKLLLELRKTGFVWRNDLGYFCRLPENLYTHSIKSLSRPKNSKYCKWLLIKHAGKNFEWLRKYLLSSH